jgi:hypothetical protein
MSIKLLGLISIQYDAKTDRYFNVNNKTEKLNQLNQQTLDTTRKIDVSFI